MKKTIYIATISGGKDSVTMCDLLLKNGYPVDYIIFNDTLDEFSEMYEYIEKVKSYFLERYEKTIITLKPTKSYDNDYIFGKISDLKEAKMAGMTRGLPNASNSFCSWRRDSKVVPFKKWIKKEKIKDHKIYIGITLNETHRVNRDSNFLYPLIDNFSMTEEKCKEYLINQEMENPLYRHFTRTGCRKCQYQSDRDFFQIWKNYHEVWQEFRNYEKRVSNLENVVNKTWFTNYRTCEDMEKLFIEADKQGSLFDFSDEPLKDCFCKI